MWTKIKDWVKENIKFYQVLQYVGLSLMFNVMHRHGVTVDLLDFWILMFAVMVYGVFSMWEGREDQKALSEKAEQESEV